ncbi:MAG: iron-sulfur cluster insertion protein ErpA [Ectothiorhodospiraceae bacterium]|nr:iron-sulfur cluster insertion protein ErpA [Ectothiorhodospiraceae bacterium]
MSEATLDAQQTITLTEKAIAEISNIKQENEIPDEFGLRIGVKGGGCSGLTYALGFDSEIKETDEVLEIEGVKVVIDAKSMFYLGGTELDYTDGLQGKGFVFNNPNAQRTCGCGSSFGA